MQVSFIVPPGADRNEAAAFAAGEGIEGLELMYHAPTADEFADAGEVCGLCERWGVRISAVGVWHLGLTDPADSGSRAVLEAALNYAGEVGAECFFTGAGEPASDDPVGALAQVWPHWEEAAFAEAMDVAVYLGHRGSFLGSEALIAAAIEHIPTLGLKLDPIGIIRNVKADPYDFLYRFGANCAFFHVKDRLVLADGEIEPPPGLGELQWGRMFGILHQHGYDGWVSIEPHGKFWNDPANRWRYIRLANRHVRQFMA